MKYLLFPALIVLLFYGISCSRLHAQESSPSASSEEVFDFNKAYKDYIYTLELYKNAHSDYQLARAQYLQSQTLPSQTKAIDNTSKMLMLRDDVMVTYLTTLRMRLSETPGVSDSDRSRLYSRLDADVAWYQNHKARIPSAASLADLVKDSDEAKSHLPQTEILAYETLATIPLGKTKELRLSLNNLVSGIKNKTEKIRQEGDHDTQKAERWILEVDQKATRSLDKEIEAQTLIVNLQSIKNKNTQSTYDQIIFRLQESYQFMKEASIYIRDILNELTTTYL